MSPLATPKFSIVNFQLSIGSHRLPDKRELGTLQNVSPPVEYPGGDTFCVLIF